MKPFIQQVPLLRFGDMIEEVDEKMEKVLAEVKRTGGTGELIVKLKFKMGEHNQVDILDEIVAKLPVRKNPKTTLFVGDDLSLQKDDPRQRTLEGVKTVAERPDLREVKSA